MLLFIVNKNHSMKGIILAGVIGDVKDGLKNMQALWFALAFTSIGLETNFSDLLKTSNRKPLYAFLISQSFNILITLLIAYLLFSKNVL